jgi:hypothetical protein
MSRVCVGFCLVFLALPVYPDNCSDRLLKEGDLIYPRAHSGWEVLENGNVCIVYLSYELSEIGVPGEIEPYVETEGCEMFSNSAVKALRRSIFRKGLFESGCEYEFGFQFEQ